MAGEDEIILLGSKSLAKDDGIQPGYATSTRGQSRHRLHMSKHCKNLTTLILTKNFHREEIPKNVSGFESLVVFALDNCALNGQIPVWLLSCRKLQVLDLSWNRLNGSIPPWIGQMESLFYLDFSNNTLTGEIPKSLTQLKSLVS
ncbi:hypothetical protein RJ639_008436 [Escallonia herrerae]|uniref:Uncharacterized protein n=1 Tax=Escallonia herrerae TaxID=1293975 RepID=A0AA88VTP4_9ASTE|nr:hypothetical protein RJ639_008436 [Escallonia herrerae]